MIEHQSAVEFAGAMRLHVALEVSDLERSIAFYQTLLGVAPTKVRTGYAKFEPAEPSVNLSLNQGASRPVSGAAHFGVQVQSTSAVEAIQKRLALAGHATRTEEATACCYAVQDKVWATDPDGNPWEVFVVTEAESPHRVEPSGECCVPASDAAADEGACCVPADVAHAASATNATNDRGACCP